MFVEEISSTLLEAPKQGIAFVERKESSKNMLQEIHEKLVGGYYFPYKYVVTARRI